MRGETDATDQFSVNIKGAAQNSRDPWVLVGVLVEGIAQTLVWWLSVSERCTGQLALTRPIRDRRDVDPRHRAAQRLILIGSVEEVG